MGQACANTSIEYIRTLPCTSGNIAVDVQHALLTTKGRIFCLNQGSRSNTLANTRVVAPRGFAALHIGIFCFWCLGLETIPRYLFGMDVWGGTAALNPAVTNHE